MESGLYKMQGTSCPVSMFKPEQAQALDELNKSPTGFGVHLQTMKDGTDVLCLVTTKAGEGAAVAMLTFEQFNGLCHIIAEIIELANAGDRPASMETVQ